MHVRERFLSFTELPAGEQALLRLWVGVYEAVAVVCARSAHGCICVACAAYDWEPCSGEPCPPTPPGCPRRFFSFANNFGGHNNQLISLLNAFALPGLAVWLRGMCVPLGQRGARENISGRGGSPLRAGGKYAPCISPFGPNDWQIVSRNLPERNFAAKKSKFSSALQKTSGTVHSRRKKGDTDTPQCHVALIRHAAPGACKFLISNHGVTHVTHDLSNCLCIPTAPCPPLISPPPASCPHGVPPRHQLILMVPNPRIE